MCLTLIFSVKSTVRDFYISNNKSPRVGELKLYYFFKNIAYYNAATCFVNFDFKLEALLL
ncbi:hypothetical protein L1275_002336 [Flavobacterium sp. HSC-61S13]|nr:hypothetical protein [Flavobacterium sp. HSC-61S13]